MGRFADTTFAFTPRTNVRDRIDVEIGDSKQAEFFPQVKVSRFDNEANIPFRLLQTEQTTDVRRLAEKVRWRTEKMFADFHEVDAQDGLPEGGTEFNITHLVKPDRPYLDFSLNPKDVVFYRQDALTAEQKAFGLVQNEEKIGSYTAYFATPRTNYVDGKLYKTGKIGEFSPSLVTDAKGRTAWTSLKIKDGILRVSLPQDFIDQAEYPLAHAAGLTFGYTTAGSSGYVNNADTIVYQPDTPASAGTIDSYSFYTESPRFGFQNPPCRMAVYNSAGTTKIEDVAEFTTGTFGPGWYTENSTAHAAITATTYNICLWSGVGGGGVGVFIAFDSGSQTKYDSETYGTLTSWPATLSNNSLGVILSMYVTYTGASGHPTMRRFGGVPGMGKGQSFGRSW